MTICHSAPKKLRGIMASVLKLSLPKAKIDFSFGCRPFVCTEKVTKFNEMRIIWIELEGLDGMGTKKIMAARLRP